ncbi:MAG: hypothetical protein IJ949_03885 [Oscillospiraceae bacterium]|nr:hypothetical protein [Oscillospiraceae bacterium]
MKRLLSILLALSLIISIIPAAFAADEPYTETYSFNNAGYTTSLLNIKDYNMKNADGKLLKNTNWYYFDAPAEVLEIVESYSSAVAYFFTHHIRMYMNYKDMTDDVKGKVNAKLALKLKAPNSVGFYVPSISMHANGNYNTLNWYVDNIDPNGKNYEFYADPKNIVLTKTLLRSSSTEIEEGTTLQAEKAVYSDGKTELVTAIASGKSNNYLFNITLTKILTPTFTASVDGKAAITLNPKETATASVTVSGTTDVTDATEKTYPVAGNFVTYHCEDVEGTNVVTVDDANGTITANAAGTATVWAKTSDGKESSKITVTVTAPAEEPEEPGEAVTDTKVSVAVQPENTEKGTVSWSGATIAEVNMGDTVTATATAKDGYVFKYWKNAIGQVLSEKAEESFVINTNSAITAVFDKVEEDAATVSVELFNANGMPFYTNDKVNKDTTFAEAIAGVETPSYTGFGSFKHWSMYADKSKIADDMLIKKNTRAVAIFNEPTAKYTVSVNGSPVHSDVLYGTEVTVSSDSADFSYWKLGEKIVSYNPNYKFTVWGDVNLVPVTGEDVEAAPVAVLDEVDGNPLLIYSVPTGYTVVEAGILFGSTADITIYSVDGGRAAAARGTGQFTAQPKAGATPAHSRGYLIFKNESGETRILYAD